MERMGSTATRGDQSLNATARTIQEKTGNKHGSNAGAGLARKTLSHAAPSNVCWRSAWRCLCVCCSWGAHAPLSCLRP
eukprot:7665923-Lingulodinium_polyedra.AAC.1